MAARELVGARVRAATASIPMALVLAACDKPPPACSAPETVALVKRIVRENLPADFPEATQAVFDAEVQITMIAPTKLDKDIAKFECEGRLEVDSSRGMMGRDQARIHEFSTEALDRLADHVRNGKLTMPIRFTSQRVDDTHQVGVAGIDRTHAVAIGAYLAARNPPAAPRSAPQEARWRSGICSGLSMTIPDQADGCVARLEQRVHALVAQIDERLTTAMQRLDAQERREVSDDFTIWKVELERCAHTPESSEEPPRATGGRCQVAMAEEKLKEVSAGRLHR